MLCQLSYWGRRPAQFTAEKRAFAARLSAGVRRFGTAARGTLAYRSPTTDGMLPAVIVYFIWRMPALVSW
jgi:hypothetical protein